MKGKIIHCLIFIIVAGVVAAAFLNADPDSYSGITILLPVMILAAIYVGILFTMYVLPAITQKGIDAVLSSNEVVEHSPLHDAQAAYARGDYEDAIEIYRSVAETEPLNRLPWVEIAKIQHDQLKDPEEALDTLRTVLEEQEWPDEDAIFFMSKIAEIELEDMDNPEECAAVLKQITELFPETRHSANATHKLKEMGYL